MSRIEKGTLEKLFDDVDPSLRIAPPIDPSLQSFLANIYGAPAQLPISGAAPHVPTIESTIKEAQKYLDRQHRKGFIKNPDLSEITAPYFRRRMAAQQYLERKTQDPGSKRSALESLFDLEPFQEFWFKSKCVIRTCAELSNLPFINPGDAGLVVSHFQDRVASIVRVMRHSGLLNERKQTDAQLRKAMMDFVKNIRQLRESLIGAIVSDGKVEFPKLTEEQRKEFEERRPRSDVPVKMAEAVTLTRQQIERDRRVVEKCMESEDFPEVYKTATKRGLSEFGLPGLSKPRPASRGFLAEVAGRMDALIRTAQEEDDEARAAQERARQAALLRSAALQRAAPVKIISNQIVRPRKVTTPPVVPPTTANPSSNYHLFWRHEDPLARNGRYHDTLEEMQSLSDRIEYPSHESDLDTITMPFTLENEAASELEHLGSEPLKDGVWTTADLTDSGEPTARLESANVEPQVGAYASSHTETIRFLLQQYIEKSGASSYANVKAEGIHRRLETIWDELGFSVQQRLNILLKYSESLEESAKLSSALRFWEQALSVSEAYRTAYVVYRDMLRRGDVQTAKTLDLYAGQLVAAEQSLLQMANTLRASFGDDLILKKRKVETLIEAKREKLALMRAQLSLK